MRLPLSDHWTLDRSFSEPNKLYLQDETSGKTWAVPARSLATALGAALRRGDSTDLPALVAAEPKPTPPAVEQGIRHWRRRGWGASLRVYLASRRVPYRDLDDSSGSVRRDLIRGYLRETPLPPAPAMPSDAVCVALPGPAPLPERAAASLLLRRRSVRVFDPCPISQSRLGDALWHGLSRVRNVRRRTRDATDPIAYFTSYGIAFRFFVAVLAVEGVESGIYEYDLEGHALARVGASRPSTSLRRFLLKSIYGNSAPMTASFVVLTVADYAAYMWRYRHARALRNLYVDCGRANHDVMLAALSLDLHSFCTPALRDGDVDQALGIDGRRFHAIYSVSYGSERTDGRHD